MSRDLSSGATRPSARWWSAGWSLRSPLRSGVHRLRARRPGAPLNAGRPVVVQSYRRGYSSQAVKRGKAAAPA